MIRWVYSTLKGTLLVSVPRGVGCRHLDFAGGGTGGYGGRDQGSRDDFEDSRRAVKGDAGRTRQISSQNLDGRFHLAGGGLCFHERAETHREAEDCAVGVDAAFHTKCQMGTFGLTKPHLVRRTSAARTKSIAYDTRLRASTQIGCPNSARQLATARHRTPPKCTIGKMEDAEYTDG